MAFNQCDGECEAKIFEDKYLRLQEDHITLKKHTIMLEDRVKILTTKVTRLMNEKKRLLQEGSNGVRKVLLRDVETEEIIQELQDKVRDLEKLNAYLRGKLLVTKQQISATPKRRTPYHNVPPRVDSGLPRNRDNIQKTRLDSYQAESAAFQSVPPYAISLMEEAHREIKTLEESVASQRGQLEIYEQQAEALREKIKIKNSEHEEELTALRSKLSQGKRQHVQENIDLIKLNRDVKDKSNQLGSLQTQYVELEEKMKVLRHSHSRIVHEYEATNGVLKDEKIKNSSLNLELRVSSSKQHYIQELQAQIDDLKNENSILKSANDLLVANAFDTERDTNLQQTEHSLRHQINQLETVLKADLAEKNKLLEELKAKRSKVEELEEQLASCTESLNEKIDEVSSYERKMKLFSQESEVDFGDLEKALALIQDQQKLNKTKLEEVPLTDVTKKQLQKNALELSELTLELDKTRDMLKLQHRINEEMKTEYDDKIADHDKVEDELRADLEEKRHLLDIRATRIKKLEYQLSDIAFGGVCDDFDGERKQKANGYIKTDKDVTSEAIKSIDRPTGKKSLDGINELHIKIMRCSGLKLKGVSTVYCVYNLLGLPEQETSVMPNSDKVEFDDHRTFFIRVDSNLHEFLTTQNMELFVVGDNSNSYLAAADITLSNLTRDQSVEGRFQLKSSDGIQIGSVDVSLYWQFKYTTPELGEIQTRNGHALDLEDDSITTVSSLDDTDSSFDSQSPTMHVEPDFRIRVLIHHLSLNKKASVLKDSKRFYIDFKFLDTPTEELETQSVLKPVPPAFGVFNFKKDFNIIGDNFERFEDMLRQSGKITFNLVSEPLEDADEDCKEVGHCFVDLKQIFSSKQDVLKRDLEIYDVGKSLIGHLNVSVRVLKIS